MGWYSSRRGGWGGFAPYVTVAELEAKAARVAERIAKKEKRELHGIHLAGRTIAKTFWGKSWCDNIESYRDYAYRLERGRKYVRSGSVIDLVITKGRVAALVVGSGRDPYEIKINIKAMSPAKWDELVKRMTGKVSSLMALAAGKLPKELLEDFCNAETGLFPKPNEIKLNCDCPDGATCCKHVAAVLYGVGARLDAEPELFFTLRGVDPQSIVSSEAVVDTLTGDAASELAGSDLGDVFGISLDAEVSENVEKVECVEKVERVEKVVKVKGGEKAKKITRDEKVSQGEQVSVVEKDDGVAALFKSVRKRLGLTQSELALRFHTHQTTISMIERGVKVPSPALVEALKQL